MKINRRFSRFLWYSWANSVGVMLPLAVDRLLVCPLLNRYLGAATFGALVWVIGLGFVFGSIAGNGFSVAVQRDYVHLSDATARSVSRTMFSLTALFTLGMLVATALVSLPAAPSAVREQAAALYVTQFAAALLRGLSRPQRSFLGLKREFGRLLIVGLVETVVLLALFAVAPTANLWIIGGVYIASNAAPLGLLIYWNPEFVRGDYCKDRVLVKRLLTSWGGGGLMTVLDTAQQYAPRLLLGFISDDTVAVTTLYVATGMASLFAIPVAQISGVVLALISAFTSTGQFLKHAAIYLMVTLGLSIAVVIGSFLVGPWLIRLLYPDVADGALQIFPWVALAGGTMVVMLMMRPLAIKFAPVRRVWTLPAATLVLNLVGLIVSVPHFGIEGAAISLLITGIASMVLWLLNFAWICRHARAAPSGDLETSVAAVID